MKKLRLALILGLGLIALASLLAWAAEGEKPQMTKEKMAEKKMQMKAEFSKCHVCKSMVPYMETEWWWSTGHEVLDLKNGVVVMHLATDKKYLGDFHKMCSAMEMAIGEVKTMTEKEAQGKMCQHCQDMASLGRSGANMESFLTQSGSLMVMTSDKPENIQKMHDLAVRMRQMLGISQSN